ncbi:MAG: GreA/GreB family elongation factor [Psychroserpens sp.]|nr:GreA/GreB family elongation factor [Psychroserpens sp.]
MSEIKKQLFSECQNFVNSKLEAIHRTIEGLQNSLTSETKSTAGDKHETGRAMLQLELEKAGQQLAELEKLNRILSKIELSQTTENISLGSLAYTTQHNYFIAISAGEIKFKDQSFYAISVHSPIGNLLLGKQKGQEIRFRDQVLEIIKID